MAVHIDATYTIVTPAFCGGAAPDHAELRLPSIKGALRFWWRSLAWSRHGTIKDENERLQSIQDEEDRVFGSAAGGQAMVAMRLAKRSPGEVMHPPSVLLDQNDNVVGEGARYFGYGVMEAFARRPRGNRPGTQAGQLTRGCLQSPAELTLQLRAGREATASDIDGLCAALRAMGTFGGLGAKSRKGYGSLTLTRLKVRGGTPVLEARDESQASSADDLRGHVMGLMQSCPDRPPYSAFFDGARIMMITSGEHDPLNLLDLLGREMLRYRSWGRGGKILSGKASSEKNFELDHDMSKGIVPVTEHPERAAFGLPHNYGRYPNQQVLPQAGDLDRRASPLFIHIHDVPNATPVAVLTFLPSRFLPPGRERLRAFGKSVKLTKPDSAFYAPVNAFLDRLLDPDQRREPFTQAWDVV